MKVGILTRNKDSWSSTQLREAMTRLKVSCSCLRFTQLSARVGYGSCLSIVKRDLAEELDALLVRPIGRGSLEEIVFRMDILHRLQRLGMYIVNPPEAIEHCADKYDVLSCLEEMRIPVPRTTATESVAEALRAFYELGSDVVVKPIFGSRGIGSTRVTDPDVALTVFKAIRDYHGVVYLQEFVPHGFSDIRAFVIGDHVTAAMRRVASTWKANYSQGAKPINIKLEKTLEDVAVKSAHIVSCKVAGVDIIEGQNGPLLVEINSQPGWKGLQSVTKANIAEEILRYVLSEFKR